MPCTFGNWPSQPDTKEPQQQDDYGHLLSEAVYVDECYTDDHKLIITTDEKYKRPAEVDLLIGDSTKARTELGWEPKYDLDMLIDDMLEWDLKRAEYDNKWNIIFKTPNICWFNNFPWNWSCRSN